MKTVGERIRQARDARGLSGEELAHAVGYKNQSAISNLENRATGTGGTKIAMIATALRVPVQWLLAGPDGPDVPFSEPMVSASDAMHLGTHSTEVSDFRPDLYDDASIAEAVTLFRKLDTYQRLKAINYMKSLTLDASTTTESTDGDSNPVPEQKAA